MRQFTKQTPSTFKSASPRVDVPVAGFYRTKLAKGAAWVPARIWLGVAIDPVTGESMDRSPMLCAEVNGRYVDPYEVWPSLVGQPITEAEFKYLTANAEWCAEHAPADPAANPRTKIDLNTVPSIF